MTSFSNYFLYIFRVLFLFNEILRITLMILLVIILMIILMAMIVTAMTSIYKVPALWQTLIKAFYQCFLKK